MSSTNPPSQAVWVWAIVHPCRRNSSAAAGPAACGLRRQDPSACGSAPVPDEYESPADSHVTVVLDCGAGCSSDAAWALVTGTDGQGRASLAEHPVVIPMPRRTAAVSSASTAPRRTPTSSMSDGWLQATETAPNTACEAAATARAAPATFRVMQGRTVTRCRLARLVRRPGMLTGPEPALPSPVGVRNASIRSTGCTHASWNDHWNATYRDDSKVDRSTRRRLVAPMQMESLKTAQDPDLGALSGASFGAHPIRASKLSAESHLSTTRCTKSDE